MVDTITKIVRADGSEVHFPAGSARGIQCEIAQSSPGELRRTVNGILIDLTRPILRKYSVILSADGVATPDMIGLWRGAAVMVAPPVTWRAHAAAGVSTLVLERPAASGLRIVDAITGASVTGGAVASDGRTVTVPTGAAGRVVEYQPVFACLVSDVSTTADEWEAAAGWSLSFEEV